MVVKVIVTSQSKIHGKQISVIPSVNNRNSPVSVLPTPPTQLPNPRPDMVGPTTPSTLSNGNRSNSKIDYGSLCTRLQPVLVQSCRTLVNTNGSLTSQGNHAMHCVKSAILLSGIPSSWVGVPLSALLNGLSMLASPTGM